MFSAASQSIPCGASLVRFPPKFFAHNNWPCGLYFFNAISVGAQGAVRLVVPFGFTLMVS